MKRSACLLGLVIAIAAFPVTVVAASRVFYDGFESGNTDLWQKDDYRNRCKVVRLSSDGVSGPLGGQSMASCNWNGTVAWNDPASFETLRLDVPSGSNELFYRIWLRLDTNVSKSAGSAGKIARIFSPSSNAPNDMFATARMGSGLANEGLAGGAQMPTYWGGATGDATASSAGWHKIEYYFDFSRGVVRVWHDGVKIRDESGRSFGGTSWSPLYILSNFADQHDASNNVYFDDIEVFTEAGSTASGTMADGSISEAGSRPMSPQSVSVE
jgi:hypothetical protein